MWDELLAARDRPATTASAPDGLAWVPSPFGEPPSAAPRGRADGLGQFNRALSSCEILDLKAFDVPGAAVAPPYGTGLIRHFRSLVEQAYLDAGLDEWEFPDVVPAKVFEPMGELLDLDGRLLTLSQGSEALPLALAPTGEGPIYHYWAGRELTGPVSLFRRATYFRPPGRRGGRGGFTSVEARDLFEFHACFADAASQSVALRALFRMLRDLVLRFRLPGLWTRRPPATNNGMLFDASYACDVPTPLGRTIFCGSLYDQGRRFSDHYGVTVGGEPAVHVSGAVSRRLLLCHLLLGLNADESFLVHPTICSADIGIVGPRSPQETEAVQILTAAGLRAHRWPPSRVGPNHPGFRCGIPLTLVLRGSGRSSLVRSDTRALLDVEDLEPAARALRLTLGQIGAAYDRRAADVADAAVIQAHDLADVRSGLDAHHVVEHSTDEFDDYVLDLARWGRGEVLGFRPGSRSGETVAVSSRRL